jgi:cation transport regulator ChaC
VKDYLDIREINGYSIQYTPFHPAPSSSSPNPTPISCLVYIGLPENPQFMGPQDPQQLAEHILRSKGPSGENREYLYQLEEALEGLSEGSRDGHVRDLARRARALESEGGWEVETGAKLQREVPLHKVGSTEEQEEVEKQV